MGMEIKDEVWGEELQLRSPCYKLFRKLIPPMYWLERMMLRDVKFGPTAKSTEPGVLEKLWHTGYITVM